MTQFGRGFNVCFETTVLIADVIMKLNKGLEKAVRKNSSSMNKITYLRQLRSSWMQKSYSLNAVPYNMDVSK